MLDLNEVAEYISNQSESSKIYIGGDSYRFVKNKRWYAEYTLVVVVHINGNRGCKIFGETSSEPDYDSNQDKPSMRLMNEVYKIADLYLKLKEVIGDREVLGADGRIRRDRHAGIWRIDGVLSDPDVHNRALHHIARAVERAFRVERVAENHAWSRAPSLEVPGWRRR